VLAVPAVLAVLAILAGVSLAAGCAAPASEPGDQVRVVSGVYPMVFLAEQVGGPRVQVSNLVPAGAEPHDLELRPQQLATVAEADLVIYLPGFQPALDEAVAAQAPQAALDALLAGGESAAAGHPDPHIWLDPQRMAAIGRELAGRLTAIDPAGSAGYQQRLHRFLDRLELLDHEISASLGACQRREFVVSHAAFGYLAGRYGLIQISISGLRPEEEPTPQHLAEVAAAARRSGTTTIFFESLTSPRTAQAIAAEVGATTEMLDPLEGQPGQGDYFSVMAANAQALGKALGCAAAPATHASPSIT
jgi:zinc transport system substrate-binding protein